MFEFEGAKGLSPSNFPLKLTLQAGLYLSESVRPLREAMPSSRFTAACSRVQVH